MTYIEYFGLREAPFSATPDPRFLYHHSSFKEALATLRYGIEVRRGFLLVTGEAGAGKTTLLRTLISSFDSATRAAYISHTRVTFTELLRTVLNDLELPDTAQDRSLMTGRLNQFLIEQLKERRIVCLLIDEAHELSHEMLEGIRLLSNLETDKEKLLQIVLVGQAELEIKLDEAELWQLKQRVVLRRRLSRVDSAEVGPYINERLKIAGYVGPELFDADAVQTIANHAKGIPRLINLICDNALAMACAASKREISAPMIDEVARDLQLRDEIQAITESPQTEFEAGEGEKELLPAPEAEYNSSRSAAMGLSARDDLKIGGMPFAPRSYAWTGVGTLLALLILTAAGLLFYSREIGNSLWKLPAKLTDEDGVRARWLEAGDVSGPLKSKSVGEASPLQGPLIGDSERITQAMSPDVMATPERKKDSKDKPEVAGAAVKRKGIKTVPAEDRPARRFESEPMSLQTKHNAQQYSKSASGERRASREIFFEVVGPSFLRSKPQSDSDIIATLPRGTWVRLIAERGDYLQIASLDDRRFSGYVHRQDALFEPLRTTVPPSRRKLR